MPSGAAVGGHAQPNSGPASANMGVARGGGARVAERHANERALAHEAASRQRVRERGAPGRDVDEDAAADTPRAPRPAGRAPCRHRLRRSVRPARRVGRRGAARSLRRRRASQARVSARARNARHSDARSMPVARRSRATIESKSRRSGRACTSPARRAIDGAIAFPALEREAGDETELRVHRGAGRRRIEHGRAAALAQRGDAGVDELAGEAAMAMRGIDQHHRDPAGRRVVGQRGGAGDQPARVVAQAERQRRRR